MKFKLLKKANIKGPDGLFLTKNEGDIVDLPESYIIHPALEEVKEGKKKQNIDLDVNKDGKVDKKDAKIMAKHLGSRGGKSKKSKKKK
jgi:hypothetical protein